MNEKKLLAKIITNQNNVRFSDFVRLVVRFGFVLDRTSGSHHIFLHPEISEMLNVQDVRGEAKPYQIKQFLKIVEKHNLKLKDTE